MKMKKILIVLFGVCIFGPYLPIEADDTMTPADKNTINRIESSSKSESKSESSDEVIEKVQQNQDKQPNNDLQNSTTSLADKLNSTISLGGMTWENLNKVGSKVNFGISYTSNSKVSFTWQYYDITKKEWNVIADNTTSNWVSFEAPHDGQYLIYVIGKDESGASKEYCIGWSVKPEKVDLLGMTWQKLTKVGSKVNFGVSYTSNSEVSFTWQYYDLSKKEWHVIANNTGSNWVTINLPHTGQYLIYVSAMTTGGTTTNYSVGWSFEEENIKLNGFTWQNKNKEGSITDIGVSYTSNSEVSFTWQYYDISKKEWHVIANNTSSNWINVRLPHIGQYLIHVSAQTPNGKTDIKYMGWSVINRPTYFSQLDGRWASNTFNGSTIGPSGCVPTSLAMILNGCYNMNVLLPDVAKTMEKYTHRAIGASGRDIINTANAYGRNVEQISSQQRAIELLKSGISLIMLEDVGIGHAVVVTGYDNGSVEVLDPFNHSFYNGRYDFSYLWATPSKDAMDWDAGRPVFAIK